MNWNNTLQSWLVNAQGTTQNQQLAQQGQTLAGAAQGLSNVVTTTTTGPYQQQQLTNYPVAGTLTGGQWNQTIGYQMSYSPPWPTMTLSLKDVALLHRMCGEDEEVRAVLNKILPHFKLEA